MTIYKSFNFNEKEQTAQVLDENYGQYLWIAFKQNNDGNCIIKKVSANDLDQTYFDIELAVTEIKKMIISGYYLFVGVDHSTNYIYRYHVSNPLSTPISFSFPTGINEPPIDAVEGGSALWWLFPGDLSGENAKIVKTSTVGLFDETIDLSQSGDIIQNARGITYKDGDLWVVTYTDPIKLVRAYQLSGGTWTFTTTQLGS